MHLYGELEWRGLVYGATDGLREALRERLTLYIGFDPTAASLHVGSLLPIMALARAQRCGHSPIALVGGGTGLIGDPSGKTAERMLLTVERVEENVAGIRAQLARFLDFNSSANPARLVNNAEWLTKLGAVEFMRDVGKHFTVNAMLARESVKRRIESEDGISYTEFSYALLQAYDFLVLHERFNCTVQMGGSDQWGNIVSGMDLIRRLRGGKAHGLVMPLITTSSGTKFGKTESGTIWLDAGRTSPFKFYQFWLNVDDKDAIAYLKYFTYLDARAIAELEAATAAAPERREAQRALAREVTRLIHGQEHVERAERASSVLFDGDLGSLPVEDVLAVFEDAPSTELAAAEFDGAGLAMVELLARLELAPSKSEARRLIQSGGVYVNNRRVADPQARLTEAEALGGRLFVVRKGQREQRLVKLI
jgi:tyrosyl-tRNA synthetase